MTKYTNTLPDSPITSVAVNIENNGELGPYLIIKHKQCNITRAISGSAIADFVNEACVKADNIIDSDSIDGIIAELTTLITYEVDKYKYSGDKTNAIDECFELNHNNQGDLTILKYPWARNEPCYTSNSLDLKHTLVSSALCNMGPDPTSEIQEEVLTTIETVIAGDHNPGE